MSPPSVVIVKTAERFRLTAASQDLSASGPRCSQGGEYLVRRIFLTISCQLLSQTYNYHKTVLRLASLENGIGNLTEKVLSSEWHVIFVGCCSWSISSWLFIWALCLFAQNDLPQQGVWALNRPTWGGTTTFYRLSFNSGFPSGCFCQVIVFLLKICKKVEIMIKQILFTLSDIENINCMESFYGKVLDELLACESIILCWPFLHSQLWY